MSSNAVHLLTINGGSSSIKFAVFTRDGLRRLGSGKIDRIGLADATLSTVQLTEGNEPTKQTQSIEIPDHEAALDVLLEYLGRVYSTGRFAAVGHRIVHGGQRFRETQIITPEVLAELRRLIQFAPEHLPSEIKLIEAIGKRMGDALQVACFDTAFHARMPRIARIVPVPRRFEASGVCRYGFHGLSYTYLLDELRRIAPEEARGRLILAHLGNGASMAAVHAGVGVDTTMGFTPAAGLVMSTRSGDLDPGVAWHLLQNEGLSVAEFYTLVNRQSGLLGVSETSSDMRDLLARANDDVRAAEAVELFCYQARKWIGAYAAVLGGLDSLVFTAGVGENAPEVRQRICRGLEFLGMHIDDEKNARNETIISRNSSSVTVRVLPTDEELVIARETLQQWKGVSVVK